MKWLVVLALSLVPAHAADLLVAAASDLATFAQPLENGFKSISNQTIRFSFASSGSLSQQINNGAPFDVFLSANEQYVMDLANRGRVDPTTVISYASGRIGVWSKDGSVRSIQDLAKPAVKHIAIPNPEFAPYGVAAKQALESRGLWKTIEPKIVYGENVRQAYQFAESGNADAVLTSWTLLIGRGSLIPADWHAPVRQAGAVVKSSAQSDNAKQFLQFLTSPAGRKILRDGGLFPPSQ